MNESLKRLGEECWEFGLRFEPTSASLLGSGSVPMATMHRLVDDWAAGS